MEKMADTVNGLIEALGGGALETVEAGSWRKADGKVAGGCRRGRDRLKIESWVEVQILITAKFTGCMIGKTWKLVK